MALPKISQPLFEVTIPSTGQKTTYRPFTVKEEKILLIAQESKDINQIILALNQLISACVFDVDVDKLATFDIEYLFIKLRATSVNNEAEFAIEDPDTGEEINLTLDLNDMKIHRDENHSPKIKLDEGVYILMRYPRIDVLRSLEHVKEDKTSAGQQALFEIMVDCIDKIVDGEDVYDLKDFSEEEVNEFLDSLTLSHVNMIKTFFETMPVLRYEMPYKLQDGTEKTFVVQGTKTLFLS